MAITIMSFKYIDYVNARRKLAPITSRLAARALLEADRRIEKQKRFFKRMEDAKTSSIQKFNDLPRNATIRKEYVKCGKNDCKISHGPYYYGYWKEKTIINNDNDKAAAAAAAAVWKLKKKYIGSYLPVTEEQKMTSSRSGSELAL